MREALVRLPDSTALPEVTASMDAPVGDGAFRSDVATSSEAALPSTTDERRTLVAAEVPTFGDFLRSDARGDLRSYGASDRGVEARRAVAKVLGRIFGGVPIDAMGRGWFDAAEFRLWKHGRRRRWADSMFEEHRRWLWRWARRAREASSADLTPITTGWFGVPMSAVFVWTNLAVLEWLLREADPELQLRMEVVVVTGFSLRQLYELRPDHFDERGVAVDVRDSSGRVRSVPLPGWTWARHGAEPYDGDFSLSATDAAARRLRRLADALAPEVSTFRELRLLGKTLRSEQRAWLGHGEV